LTPKPPSTHSDRSLRPAILWPALLFCAALAWFSIRLAVPPVYYFDEIYYAYTAGQYLRLNPDAFVWYTNAPPIPRVQIARSQPSGVAYTWSHPPLGFLLMAAGIAVLGDGPSGWRSSSALFGAIGVVVAFLLALAATGRRRVALLLSSFLILDGSYFVQSRIGMLDIFVTVFMLGALYAAHRYLASGPGANRRPMLLVGTCLGLAIATKWSAAYGATLIGLTVLARSLALSRGTPQRTEARQTSAVRKTTHSDRVGPCRELLWVGITLVVLPAAIYVAAYVPFFLSGHGVGEFFELQKRMYLYQTGLKAAHAYHSSWWEWPLVLRPVLYFADHHIDPVTRKFEWGAIIYANGNPLLYWAFLPAVGYVTWSWWRERRAALIVLLIGFLGQWLPWALVPRITFAYYFLPSAPFGCLAVAVLVSDAFDRAGGRRLVATAYVALVAVAFAFFYPIHSAVPLSLDAFDMRIWFESWR
jgi:dolichyl-phosphate-mannose--protein O-mannosyl transferase